VTGECFPEDSIHPQPGPQELFLASSADIVVYGGAAGGGKSYALLIEGLRHIFRVKDYGAVIFRRTYPEIKAEGSLWDTSRKIYSQIGGTSKESDLSWSFKPHNNTVSFAHLEHDKDVHKYQGAQMPFIGFDELTTFTEYQFFYLLSRNRSACGVRPYVRATCNPDPDSWLAGFISWWIDHDTGYPIMERSGVLRWFIRMNDELIWASSRDELLAKYGSEVMPKSVTFIPARLSDNRILETQNPEYRANLLALPMVERERLLNGNWKIRAQAGTVFRREWFEITDEAPKNARLIRYWDKAATEPSSSNPDPDYTVGVLLAVSNGNYFVLDVVRIRKRPGDVEATIKSTADLDGRTVEIGMEQEPGSSGEDTIFHYARDVLPGFNFHGYRATGDKLTRALPLAAAAQNHLIKIIRAPWNLPLLNELEAFPTGGVHDDQVDGMSGAFNRLTLKAGGNFHFYSGNRKW
jgi:predicted phage terminase large subunit-like protein